MLLVGMAGASSASVPESEMLAGPIRYHHRVTPWANVVATATQLSGRKSGTDR
jgi:hypothetical protein